MPIPNHGAGTRMLGPVALLAVVGCSSASVQDPISHQLVSIHHQSGPPVASLAVNDDGSYALLDELERNEVRGQLTDEELSGVEEHAGSSAMTRLLAGRVPDEDCAKEAAAYMVVTQHGDGCLALAALTDSTASNDLTFLINLFSSKATR